MDYVVVFITVPNQKEGKKIGARLLEEKLAACVNFVGGIDSTYWWQGKIESSKEVLLIAKTKKSVFKRLAKCVKGMHPYKVPEIIALPIVEGDKEYLKWLGQSVK